MLNDFYGYRFFLLKIAKENLNSSLHSWAEDLVQDAFVKAAKNSANFDANKGKLSTWLAQITINLCRDFSKKRVNKEVCYGDFFSFTTSSAWETPRVKYKDLQPYLSQLSPRYRQVLILKYRFELTAKEMEKYMNVQAKSVPVLVQRAKESLGAVMKSDGPSFSKAA
jgi:RNA polymerase sigma factor (sigma-70 family)